jgi:hypothetical protein
VKKPKGKWYGKRKLDTYEAAQLVILRNVEEVLDDLTEAFAREASDVYLGDEIRRIARGCLGAVCMTRDRIRNRFAGIRQNPRPVRERREP